MLVQIRQRSDRDDLQIRDQGSFGRVHLRDKHALEALGTCCGSHRQDAARVANHPVQRKLPDDDRVFHSALRQKPGQEHYAERDRQVVGGTFLAHRSRSEIDHHAMTREIQACILHRGLDALAAFLHGSIRQTNNNDGGQAVGIIHFHFNNDAFEADHSTGVHARKHERECRRGISKCQLTGSICPMMRFSVQSAKRIASQIRL